MHPSAELILNRADQAATEAKTKGGNQVISYGPDVAVNWRQVEELKQAIECREFILYYQPIAAVADCFDSEGTLRDLATVLPIGYEALVRWQKPDGSIVGPGEFIPRLEKTGNIFPLERQIFEMAAKAQARLANPEQWISVNLSPSTLSHPEFKTVYGNISQLKKIEITERQPLDDAGIKRLQWIRQQRFINRKGPLLAVDDLGTGYSKFATLNQYDVLKVDMSLVEGIGRDNDAYTICKAIVQLGQSLRMHVVAEGVETPEQLRALRLMKCEFIQGYLYGRPGPLVANEEKMAC